MSKDVSLTPMKIAGRLTIICVVAIFLLTGANLLTKRKIDANSIAEEDKVNKELFVDGKFEKFFFNTINDKEQKFFYYYKVFDLYNNLLGYIVYSQGKGFNGDMKIGFSTDTSLKILKVKLMDNAETPGYGKKYEKENNIRMFINSNTFEKKIPYRLSDLTQDEKDTVTSATISFKGVAKSIQKGVDLLKDEIK